MLRNVFACTVTETNAWSPFARLLMPRTRHGAALLAEGKLLVAGGYRSIANDPPTVATIARKGSPCLRYHSVRPATYR